MLDAKQSFIIRLVLTLSSHHLSHTILAALHTAAMSVKKSVSLNGGIAIANLKGQKSSKRRRFDRLFSSVELSMEPGKQLKDMDSNKLKADIKRWAKAVVAYARQISGRFGKSRG
uniref:Uncharacterized protein n=1 Tax=Phaseolus vulgaris TaxID=3885 RepID=V7APK0_PHAVU|nr:hypothetical protein PHAVU_010G142400g [Phaseolus vulgaris]ESW07587.1 hypothetical protein PHAVU_010G142400g [Phaseolus vulgaris]